MDLKASPLAPDTLGIAHPVAGVSMSVFETGLKYSARPDLLLMIFDEGTTGAGVFTRSLCPSAPVDWCKEHLNAPPRAVVVNAGNANAFTGKKGRQSAQKTAGFAAKALGCGPEHIRLASTGVIGEPLSVDGYEEALVQMAGEARMDLWEDAANAIRTTDTFKKYASVQITLDGQPITITGIVKGSGMIEPNMGTMLGFIATDAPIAQPLLQEVLSKVSDQTFNSITVDSDTSTSDTVLLFATGKAPISPIDDRSDKRVKSFQEGLQKVCLELAQLVVKDGEGASKFVEISVSGAKSSQSARKIAKAVANSPLVKTAIAGEDANWGRIVMAVGKSGEPADRDQLSISFGDVEVARNGERAEEYSEAVVSKIMKNQEITIGIDVGIGRGKATVWTCDFTRTYIEINADYRS